MRSTKLLLLATITIAPLVGQGSIPVQLATSIDGNPLLPPMYRTVLGRSVLRFKASVVGGRFKNPKYSGQGDEYKLLGPWVLEHVIQKAQIDGGPNFSMQEFQVRISNMGSNEQFPAGYSFWRAND